MGGEEEGRAGSTRLECDWQKKKVKSGLSNEIQTIRDSGFHRHPERVIRQMKECMQDFTPMSFT